MPPLWLLQQHRLSFQPSTTGLLAEAGLRCAKPLHVHQRPTGGPLDVIRRLPCLHCAYCRCWETDSAARNNVCRECVGRDDGQGIPVNTLPDFVGIKDVSIAGAYSIRVTCDTGSTVQCDVLFRYLMPIYYLHILNCVYCSDVHMSGWVTLHISSSGFYRRKNRNTFQNNLQAFVMKYSSQNKSKNLHKRIE